jgi:hypothetical protein
MIPQDRIKAAAGPDPADVAIALRVGGRRVPADVITGRPTGLAAIGTGFIMSGIQAIIGV